MHTWAGKQRKFHDIKASDRAATDVLRPLLTKIPKFAYIEVQACFCDGGTTSDIGAFLLPDGFETCSRSSAMTRKDLSGSSSPGFCWYA